MSRRVLIAALSRIGRIAPPRKPGVNRARRLLGRLVGVAVAVPVLACLNPAGAAASPLQIHYAYCEATAYNGPNGMDFQCYTAVSGGTGGSGYQYYWYPELAGHITVQNWDSPYTEGLCTRNTTWDVVLTVWSGIPYSSGSSHITRDVPVPCYGVV